jgi:hypothetical protein
VGTGSFPGVKRPGRGADQPSFLVPRSKKSRAIRLPLSGSSGLLRGTFTLVFSYNLFNEEFGSLEYAAWNGNMAPEQCMVKDVEGGGRGLI